MKFIKKVSVSSLDTSGRVIDSLISGDNPRLNAPSIKAVKTANAELTNRLQELEDQQYFSNGETINFDGDGWYVGALFVGVWNIDTAYFIFTLPKKLKANQTVNAAIVGNGMITTKNGGFMNITPAGVPISYNIFTETLPASNQVKINIKFVDSSIDLGGFVSYSGGGLKLTIEEG